MLGAKEEKEEKVKVEDQLNDDGIKEPEIGLDETKKKPYTITRGVKKQ
jgi:hypothetical protein